MAEAEEPMDVVDVGENSVRIAWLGRLDTY